MFGNFAQQMKAKMSLLLGNGGAPFRMVPPQVTGNSASLGESAILRDLAATRTSAPRHSRSDWLDIEDDEEPARSRQTDPNEILAGQMARQVKDDIDAQVKGQLAAHPLLAPLAAAGIDSPRAVMNLLAAAEAGREVLMRQEQARRQQEAETRRLSATALGRAAIASRHQSQQAAQQGGNSAQDDAETRCLARTALGRAALARRQKAS